MRLELPEARVREALDWICGAVRESGGRALLVGGCVRDMALGHPGKDVDVEVFHLAPEALQRLLARRFRVDLVGKSFGVLKIQHLPIDVAIARRESKSGQGHKGFAVQADPFLSLEEAAARRDFTINAISYDPLDGAVLDPFHGLDDLRDGVLRHVSAQFSEDPLRVLRAMQFAARFELRVAAETVALCRGITPEGLPMERIGDEWKKLITRGIRPAIGLRFLRDCGWVRYYPELEAMIGCPQEAEWHPEGDVWTHIGHVMDAFARERVGDDWEDQVVGYAALCHDLGKPLTTREERGRIRSPAHDRAGEAPTRALLARLTNQHDFVEQVVTLVLHHHRPHDFFEQGASDTAIRRLAGKVQRLDRLVRVARADSQGRPPLPFHGFPAGDWLLAAATRLAVADSAPQPLVLGRHLIQLGLTPGPHFTPILAACFEAQLDGKFSSVDEAMALARELIARMSSTSHAGNA